MTGQGLVVGGVRLSDEEYVSRLLAGLLERFSKRYSFSVRYAGLRRISPGILYSTEPFLESEKLGAVLVASLYHGYRVPIIVVLSGGRMYIYDGHHRARVYHWLRKSIEAHVVYAGGYRPRVAVELPWTPIVNREAGVPEPLRSIRHAVNIIWFLERTHRVSASLWRGRVAVDEIYATQPMVERLTGCRWWPPPLLYYYDRKHYVLDGHKRICCRIARGEREVDAILFTLGEEIGIMRTSRSYRRPIAELCPPR